MKSTSTLYRLCYLNVLARDATVKMFFLTLATGPSLEEKKLLRADLFLFLFIFSGRFRGDPFSKGSIYGKIYKKSQKLSSLQKLAKSLPRVSILFKWILLSEWWLKFSTYITLKWWHFDVASRLWINLDLKPFKRWLPMEWSLNKIAMQLPAIEWYPAFPIIYLVKPLNGKYLLNRF